MKVVAFLKQCAAKAGIVTLLDETRAEERAGGETRCVSLDELLEEVERSRQQSITACAPELSVGFDRIFQSFKIAAPAHGWDVDRVLAFLRSEKIKPLGPDAAKCELMVALAAQRVPVEDLLRDAVRRDQALDSYERLAYGKLQERKAGRAREVELLKRNIRSCQKKIKEVQHMQSKDEDAFKAWVKAKILREEEMVNAVAHFTREHKVSVGSVTAARGDDAREAGVADASTS